MLAKYPYCMASARVWYTIIQDLIRGQGALAEGLPGYAGDDRRGRLVQAFLATTLGP